MSNASSKLSSMYCGFIGGHSLGTASGVIIEGAIVVTVTVKAADEDPFSTTEVGATVQTPTRPTSSRGLVKRWRISVANLDRS